MSGRCPSTTTTPKPTVTASAASRSTYGCVTTKIWTRSSTGSVAGPKCAACTWPAGTTEVQPEPEQRRCRHDRRQTPGPAPASGTRNQMHTPEERPSWIAAVLRGLDPAAANLDRAIDALTETASPGRA